MSATESRLPQKVRVCCLCERWESGGIESFLCNVLSQMDMRGIQVDIAAAELMESIFTEPLKKHGVRFFELSGSQRNLRGNYSRFKELLEKERYDVVHLHIFHGLSLYYAVLAERAGVPVRIVHSHNTALRKSLTRPVKQLIHGVARERYTRAATDLWACSAAAAEFLFSKRILTARGYRFIPNGLETERFQFDPVVRLMVRRELGFEDQFVIGNIGRLCYQKNQSFLLDIFAEVQKQKPESRLLLVGEGEAHFRLEQQVEQLGLTEKVLFYGTTNHVEQLYWAMDVFVFPSRFEGLGIAVVEAQTAGLPVVCSEHVPREACVTSLFHSLPLAAGAEKWGDTLLQLLDGPMERQKYAAKIKNSGFDAFDVSERIGRYYMRSYFHGST